MSDAAKLTFRVAGCFAPKGSPERDYFDASVSFGVDSEQFKAAEKRLAEFGCPPFTSDETPVWDGSTWKIENRNV